MATEVGVARPYCPSAEPSHMTTPRPWRARGVVLGMSHLEPLRRTTGNDADSQAPGGALHLRAHDGT
jgi:hypothetical protein